MIVDEILCPRFHHGVRKSYRGLFAVEIDESNELGQFFAAGVQRESITNFSHDRKHRRQSFERPSNRRQHN